ncbi:hypothetical protein PR048_014304 [Dryococelus australis]|uniref:Uncharacterized protein n=1 Tax=Dryococelus australis TaxID=614101 RepID=A0ABQ9HDV7_9NEOP|nr:hypothetical protein PR048_014304 [Dryococelus australis]
MCLIARIHAAAAHVQASQNVITATEDDMLSRCRLCIREGGHHLDSFLNFVTNCCTALIARNNILLIPDAGDERHNQCSPLVQSLRRSKLASGLWWANAPRPTSIKGRTQNGCVRLPLAALPETDSGSMFKVGTFQLVITVVARQYVRLVAYMASARLGRARQSSAQLRGCSEAFDSGLSNVSEGAHTTVRGGEVVRKLTFHYREPGSIPISVAVDIHICAARRVLPLAGGVFSVYSHLIRTEQRHDGNTARLARTSDEALGVSVSVEPIALSLLDLQCAGRMAKERERERETSFSCPGCRMRLSTSFRPRCRNEGGDNQRITSSTLAARKFPQIAPHVIGAVRRLRTAANSELIITRARVRQRCVAELVSDTTVSPCEPSSSDHNSTSHRHLQSSPEMLKMLYVSTNTCIVPPLHGHPDASMNPWKIPDCFATRHNSFKEGAHIVHWGCIHATGATVEKRLARSPPTKANRVQSPAESPDFPMWESCRAMPLVGGFSRESPVSPSLSFRCRYKFTLIITGSQHLSVKGRPNIFTHCMLLAFHVGEPGSIPSGVTPEFSHVGIVPDDTVGRQVFSGISRFPRPPGFRAAPHSPHFILTVSEDRDVKGHPNLSYVHATLMEQIVFRYMEVV